MTGRRALEQPDGALEFFGGRRVTRSKEAGGSTTKDNWEAVDFNVPNGFETTVKPLIQVAP